MALLRILVAFLLLQTASWASPAGSAANQHLAGVQLAESVSEITGTAISPLLGVSSVGAWRYYRTPEHLRKSLPWFCHPLVWTGGFILLGVCFLKDLFGTAAPSLLKKPLDFVELFENKLSALVAGTAFVPIIAAELSRHAQAADAAAAGGGLPSAQYAAVGFLGGLPSYGITALTIGFAITGFAVVWLASHAINVLIALSPFTTVDAGLKLLKLVLLSMVTAGAFLSPVLCIGFCLLLVLTAALIAPWTFRFTLFGTVFAWDTVAARLLGRTEQSNFARPRCFTTRGFGGLPVRTLGRLQRNASGALVFWYRRWMILPGREVPMPDGTVALSKGILCPVLLHCPPAGEKRTRELLLLLPRYASVESTVADQLGIGDLRDGTVLRGLKAVRLWLLEIFGFGRPTSQAVC